MYIYIKLLKSMYIYRIPISFFINIKYLEIFEKSIPDKSCKEFFTRLFFKEYSLKRI